MLSHDDTVESAMYCLVSEETQTAPHWSRLGIDSSDVLTRYEMPENLVVLPRGSGRARLLPDQCSPKEAPNHVCFSTIYFPFWAAALSDQSQCQVLRCINV
jgi:hypothetical protein